MSVASVEEPLRGLGAVVTGASRGIGLATASRLTAAGARVAMVARTEAVLERAAAEAGGEAFPADVADEAAVKDLERRLAAAGYRPGLLVNCAGAFQVAPLLETSLQSFEIQLKVNLIAPFLMVRALLPGMLERGAGQIIDVGSVAGRVALPGNAAYGASKYGLRGLHEVLVQELSGSGVRATLIEPAATDTPLWDPLDPDSSDALPSRAAMLSADEVAGAVLYAATQPPGVEVGVLSIRSTR